MTKARATLQNELDALEDMNTDRYWEAGREQNLFVGRTIRRAVAQANRGYILLKGFGDHDTTWLIPETRWEEFRTRFGSRFVPFHDVKVGFADVKAFAEEVGFLVEAPY